MAAGRPGLVAPLARKALVSAAALMLSCAIATPTPRPTPHARATTPRPHATMAPNFVYLSAVAPSIAQDIRYAGGYNFIGRPVDGYEASECILTAQAALALKYVQQELRKDGLTLRVYDCYRPTRAVDEFVAWAHDPSDHRMKIAFYPNVSKADLFKDGYLSAKSAHSRGSTVDLTIEMLATAPHRPWAPGDPLRNCTAPFVQRYHDGSIDMGTGYDCLDPLSFEDASVGAIAQSHRRLLTAVMAEHGFKGYAREWWHFTLAREPYPSTYFNFLIEPRAR